MKLVASLLFLPVVALAAPSDHQAQMDQIFKMAKSRMLPMLEQSVPAMERTRNCLQAAESKDDFIECTTIMRDLQQKMMQNLAPQGAPHQKRPPKEEFDASKIEWNAETKAQMLTDITQSVEQGQGPPKAALREAIAPPRWRAAWKRRASPVIRTNASR